MVSVNFSGIQTLNPELLEPMFHILNSRPLQAEFSNKEITQLTGYKYIRFIVRKT